MQKKLYAPAVIASAIWFIFPFLYELISRSKIGYTYLSDTFYLFVLTLFFLPYVFSSILSSLYVDKKNDSVAESQNSLFLPQNESFTSRKICRILCNVSINGAKIGTFRNLIINSVDGFINEYYIDNKKVNYINILANFAILINFLLLYRIVRWIGTTNIGRIIYQFRITTLYSPELFPTDINLLRYFFSLTPPLLIFIFLYSVPVKKYKIALLISETAIIVVIYAAKAMLIKALVIVFAILLVKKKLTIRNVLALLLLFIIAIIYVTSNRDGAYVNRNDFTDYIFLYLLSSLPALDKLLCGTVTYVNEAFGAQTLSFFYRFSGKIFGTPIPVFNDVETTVATPNGAITTNVFTSLGVYYLDYKLIGLLIYGIISGIVFGWVYKKGFIKHNKMFVVFYILECYALVTQFFGDVFFTYLSMPIQDLIWTIIVALPIAVNIPRVKITTIRVFRLLRSQKAIK